MIDAHDTAARVTILHAVGRRADELRRTIDPAQQPATPAEHIARLVGSLGCLAFADSGSEREGFLIDLMADALAWLEDLERERRAA